jgi:hypothetical protein
MRKVIKKYIKEMEIKLNKLKLSVTTILFVFLSRKCVFAAIGDFKLFSGTQNLVNDLTTWALIIIPVISVLLFIYYSARKAMADQNEQTMWTKRRNVAVVCCLGAELADGLIAWILSYYQ